MANENDKFTDKLNDKRNEKYKCVVNLKEWGTNERTMRRFFFVKIYVAYSRTRELAYSTINVENEREWEWMTYMVHFLGTDWRGRGLLLGGGGAKYSFRHSTTKHLCVPCVTPLDSRPLLTKLGDQADGRKNRRESPKLFAHGHL